MCLPTISVHSILQSVASHSIVLAVALLLTGCATYKSLPGATIADTPVRGGTTAFELAVETFALDLKDSAANPGQTALAFKAFRSGRAMLDLQCDRYLDAVGSANQAASNERKQLGLIGGFASAIMGLTGSSAKEIAAVATTLSFAASSMDSFTTTYLFSDAAKSVTKIVRESQSAFLGSVQGGMGGMDYSDALTVLGRYETVCRPAQIRALIDEALSKGNVVAVNAPAPAPAAPSPSSPPAQGITPQGLPQPGQAPAPRLLQLPVLTVR